MFAQHAVAFARLLSTRRQQLGLTQWQLALGAGLSYELVRQYEQGQMHRIPRRATIEKLSQTLKLDARRLLAVAVPLADLGEVLLHHEDR
jgi:transcriptional regulator with XRE-family HTH domain